MESNGISINDFKEAQAGLPSEFVPIDDEFLEKYKTEIGIIKQYYEPVGGIHLLESGEFQAICRVPNNQILKKVQSRSKNLDGFESDLTLVGECLIYPSAQTVGDWIKRGATGIASVFSKKLLEQAHVLQEATAKKL